VDWVVWIKERPDASSLSTVINHQLKDFTIYLEAATS
jgi:hypothetical protein